MKPATIGYWLSTALLALVFIGGGVADLTRSPQVVEGMQHLGYPAYVATLLGVWKVLGGLAVLVPGFSRVKEWAYAGMVFDLTGAAFSHLSSGDDAAKVMTPLVLGTLVVASYLLKSARGRATTSRPMAGRDPVGA